MTDFEPVTDLEPVTDVSRAPARAARGNRAVGAAEDVAAAVMAAEAAARKAGVQVREIGSLVELDAVYRLYDEIWRPDVANPPVTRELLRALSKAGSYVAGAFDAGALVGACVGFFGAPAEGRLHSHIAGVSDATRGRSVGFALKVHQRAWATLRGVSVVEWTFDPLVRRNAYFNIGKLAARPTEYLVNFYGGMHDAINGDDDSDRLLVRWALGAPDVAAACGGAGVDADARAEEAAGADIALGRSQSGAPCLGPRTAPSVLVAVPLDIEALRRRDPPLSRDWRLAVRDVLGSLLDDGRRITGFDRTGCYVLHHPDHPGNEARR